MILFLLWLALFAYPPRRAVDGYWSRHNALMIFMPRQKGRWPNGNVREYVRVQEFGEFRLLKLIGLIPLGLMWLIGPQGDGPMETAVLQTVLGLVSIIPVEVGLRGAIDPAGHGAEIIAAEKAGDTEYRAGEIERMALGEYKGRDVEAVLARWHWLARVVHLLGRW